MKATEVRLGNWIWNEKRHFVKIGDIIIRSDGAYINNRHESQCLPIPLTEELLLKCGLAKNGGNKKFYDRFTLGGFTLKCWFSPKSKAGTVTYRRTSIESLHHLQNIYFALTGKELPVAM